MFEACAMSWPSHKLTILKRLWNATSSFKGQTTTQISQKTILKMTEAMAIAYGEGVQDDWTDQKITKALKAKDHH